MNKLATYTLICVTLIGCSTPGPRWGPRSEQYKLDRAYCEKRMEPIEARLTRGAKAFLLTGPLAVAAAVGSIGSGGTFIGGLAVLAGFTTTVAGVHHFRENHIEAQIADCMQARGAVRILVEQKEEERESTRGSSTATR